MRASVPVIIPEHGANRLGASVFPHAPKLLYEMSIIMNVDQEARPDVKKSSNILSPQRWIIADRSITLRSPTTSAYQDAARIGLLSGTEWNLDQQRMELAPDGVATSTPYPDNRINEENQQQNNNDRNEISRNLNSIIQTLEPATAKEMRDHIGETNRRKQNKYQQKQRRLKQAISAFNRGDEIPSFPKYYSVQFPSMNIEKEINVISVDQDIRSKIGIPDDIKKQNKDTLLIKVKSNIQGCNLSNITRLANYDVVVSENKALNQSRGTVYSEAMSHSTIDELQETLKSQNVIKVERMKKRVNGELVDTHRYIITFAKPDLPQSIKVATWHHELIDVYIPKPMRCNKCQKLGHTAKNCRREEAVCAKCGQEGHIYRTCNNEPKCVLCSGPHPSTSNKCPSYIFKSEVLATQARMRCTFREAEDRIKLQYREENKSYSFVVKQQRTPNSQQSQRPSQEEDDRRRLQEEDIRRNKEEETSMQLSLNPQITEEDGMAQDDKNGSDMETVPQAVSEEKN